MGKRTAQKDASKDTTSDSQVNSNFPYRWPPASLTFNIYFYLFLYLYIKRKTINNGTSHQKSPKNQNRRAALGRPAVKLLGAWTSLRSTNPRPWFYFGSPDKTSTNYKIKTDNTQTKSKAGSWIEGRVATLLESHTRQYDTTAMKRARKKKKKKEQLRGDKTEVPPWDGQHWNFWGTSTSLRSTNPRPYFCLGSSDT